MRRTYFLALTAVAAFVVAAGIMLYFAPDPIEDSDYLVAGSIATLIALFVLFLGWALPRAQDVFFKKRTKHY